MQTTFPHKSTESGNLKADAQGCGGLTSDLRG
jgi:hypothetical protein